MRKLKRNLCKNFNHRWVYYLSVGSSFFPEHQYRHCKRCGNLQEYRIYPDNYPLQSLSSGWYTLVERTDKGAEAFLNTSHLENIQS